MPSSGPTIAVAVPTRDSAAAAGTPSSSSQPPSRSPSSTTVFEVINVLSSYTQNHERLKVLRVSLSVIRFLSILNFVYTILGLTFLLLALCRDWTPQFDEYQRNEFFRIGLFVSVFAPLATCVDLLALRGLQSWRRGYLLPWLTLYGFINIILFAHALSGIFHYGFKWTFLILMMCVFCLYSSWRHIRRQYTEMLLERPSCRTIEQLASDIRSVEQQQQANRVRENDLPPKYEDLVQAPSSSSASASASAATASATVVNEEEDSPPMYSETMSPSASTASGAAVQK